MTDGRWEISMGPPSNPTGGLRAEITRTRLTMRAQGDGWVGTAKLTGRFLERGDLTCVDALALLVVLLVHREEEGEEAGHWYVEEDFLVVRVQPLQIEQSGAEDGTFELTIVLALTATSLPDGMSEIDAVGDVLDYIFSDISYEIDEGDNEADAGEIVIRA